MTGGVPRRAGLLALGALLAWGSAGATAARLRPGAWDALLCVSTGAARANCGPARADVGPDGELRVRVDDVVYHLRLRSARLDLVLMHGAVQIDEFTTAYAWTGRTLKFADDEHATRYEVRFPKTGPAPR